MSCACKIQVGIYNSIGIAWSRGVSVGKFSANGNVFFHWLNLLTRAPSSIIHHQKLANYCLTATSERPLPHTLKLALGTTPVQHTPHSVQLSPERPLLNNYNNTNLFASIPPSNHIHAVAFQQKL